MTLLTASITQFGDEPTLIPALLAHPRHAVRITFAAGQAVWMISHEDVRDSLPLGSSVLAAKLTDAPMPNINRDAGFDTGKTTISTLEYQFVDIDDELSDELASKNLNGESSYNRIIEEWEFERGEKLERTEGGVTKLRAPKFTGQIQSHSKPYNVVKIKTADINRELDEYIFDPLEWRLRASITADQTTIQTTLSPLEVISYQATFAHAPWYLANPSATGAYARLEETGEIFWYTAFEDINGIATFTGVIRGQLRTIASSVPVPADTEDKNKSKVIEWMLLDETATGTVEAVITGKTPDGRPIPAHWTAGSDPQWINLYSFAKHSDVLRFQFQNYGRVKCRDFYQNEILPYVGAVLVVNGSGELVWTPRARPVDEDAGEIVLSPANCVDKNDMVLEHIFDGIRPTIKLFFDYDAIADNYKGEYRNQVVYRDKQAEDKFKIGEGKKVKELKSKGLHAGIHTSAQLLKMVSTYGDDHFDSKLSLSVESFINTIPLGTLVTADFPLVFDDTTGKPLRRTMLVIAAAENRTTRTTTYRLSASQYTQSERQASQSLHNIPVEEYKRGKVNLATLSGISITNSIATGNIILNMGTDYYYVNDDAPGTGLELSENLNVTVIGTGRQIGLYVFGPLDIKCVIDLKGKSGHGGGKGATQNVSATRGGVGFVGATRSSGAFDSKVIYSSSISSNTTVYNSTGIEVTKINTGLATVGQFTRLPEPPIDINNGLFSGIAPDMGGTGGSGGLLSEFYDSDRRPRNFAGDGRPQVPSTVYINGSDGGDGGGSFLTVSWGVSITGNGFIDLSGTDAAPVNSHTDNGIVLKGSRGSGGGPGSYMAVIDGNHPVPLFTNTNVIANYGDGAITGSFVSLNQRIRYANAGNYRSAHQAIGSAFNYFQSHARHAYTPEAETIQERPTSEISEFFRRQRDGEAVIFVGIRESNADLGDIFITQENLDSNEPRPPIEILDVDGWRPYDWDVDLFKGFYAGLIALNREYGTRVWLSGEEFPTEFNDGDAFTNELTGDTYILREDGDHERILRNDAAVGDERNQDFAFTLTKDSYLAEGFIYYVGLTDAATLPIQTGTGTVPNNGGGSLQAPTNVSGLVFSANTGAIQFGTVPNITEYGIFLDGVRVDQVSGGYYEFTTLSAGTSYVLGVRSEQAGDTSSVVTATITTSGANTGGGTSSVPAPSSLSFTAFSSTSGELSWTRSNPESAIDGYRIYRNSAVVGTTNGNTFFMDDMAASTTYAFRVVAYSGSTDESNAATVNGTTQSGGGGGTTTGTFAVVSDGPTVQVTGTAEMEGRGLFMEFRDAGNNVTHSQSVNFIGGVVNYTPPNPASYSFWTAFIIDNNGVASSLPNQPRAYNQ